MGRRAETEKKQNKKQDKKTSHGKWISLVNIKRYTLTTGPGDKGRGGREES